MKPLKLKQQFLLKSGLTYLNFGAFGGCPRPVFDAYQAFQLEAEQDPTLFFQEKGPAYLNTAREALAHFLNCSADDVVYVTNPSYGVNIVAKSLPLQPGDEVLTTNLEYGACDRTWSYYCEKKGATLVRQPIRFPLASSEDFIAQFVAGINSNTKLIFISQVTSATGLRLPVEAICAIAKERGIPCFVDGAHAVGQLPVDLSTLGATMYTGACHKWMLAPKGSSFLFVEKEWQQILDPLLVSWGYHSINPSHSQFLDYHQMQGTRDYAAFLATTAAIAFMQEHDWKTVSATCKAITQNNAHRFAELLGTTPLSPVTDDFVAQLYSLPIVTDSPQQLHDVLYNQYHIQIPIMQHGDTSFLRYSIQGYNQQSDVDALYLALEELKGKYWEYAG